MVLVVARSNSVIVSNFISAKSLFKSYRCCLTSDLLISVVVFFDLEAGLKLALYPRKSLALDATLPLGQPSATELSIGHNVTSKQEVDAVMEQARMAGAILVKPAQDTFWGGYAGYFQDPDQHLWEIAWNPQWLADDEA